MIQSYEVFVRAQQTWREKTLKIVVFEIGTFTSQTYTYTFTYTFTSQKLPLPRIFMNVNISVDKIGMVFLLLFYLRQPSFKNPSLDGNVWTFWCHATWNDKQFEH